MTMTKCARHPHRVRARRLKALKRLESKKQKTETDLKEIEILKERTKAE